MENGQLRVGGSHLPATFLINDGNVTNPRGWSCFVASKTWQFQCTNGVDIPSGVSMGTDGILFYENNPTLYACPTSRAEWNILAALVDRPWKCVPISVIADGSGKAEDRALPPPLKTVNRRQIYQESPSEGLFRPSTEYLTYYRTKYGADAAKYIYGLSTGKLYHNKL